MNTFPLYNNLSTQIGDKPKKLNIKQKKDFIEKIKTLDDKGFELIFILIQNYLLDIQESCCTTPYKSKIVSKNGNLINIKLNINQLPSKLQQILYNFVLMHIKKMLEDKLILSGKKINVDNKNE